MIVRRLEGNERFEAGRISMICFHSRIEDPESRRAEAVASKDEDWGAFTPDGKLAAHIINNHFECHLDGRPVCCGGIGAVSTLPEYRETGAIRAIFASLLPAARERGEALSALYPFSHAFYRRFGYETVSAGVKYSFAPRQLSAFRFSGEIRQWRPGEDTAPFERIYAAFAPAYNLSMLRNGVRLKEEHLSANYWKDRRFAYLLREDGEDIAYLIFDDIYHDPMAILSVREAAWVSPAGFRAVLAFLGRFSADYGTVEWVLPSGTELRGIFSDPYDVRCEPECCYMLRVMHTEKALSAMKRPGDAVFTLRVTGDEQLEENNGVYRVTGAEVQRLPEDAEADLTLSHRALALLICGAANLDGILLRPDAFLHGNADTLRRVFTVRACWVGDHF